MSKIGNQTENNNQLVQTTNNLQSNQTENNSQLVRSTYTLKNLCHLIIKKWVTDPSTVNRMEDIYSYASKVFPLQATFQTQNKFRKPNLLLRSFFEYLKKLEQELDLTLIWPLTKYKTHSKQTDLSVLQAISTTKPKPVQFFEYLKSVIDVLPAEGEKTAVAQQPNNTTTISSTTSIAVEPAVETVPTKPSNYINGINMADNDVMLPHYDKLYKLKIPTLKELLGDRAPKGHVMKKVILHQYLQLCLDKVCQHLTEKSLRRYLGSNSIEILKKMMISDCAHEHRNNIIILINILRQIKTMTSLDCRPSTIVSCLTQEVKTNIQQCNLPVNLKIPVIVSLKKFMEQERLEVQQREAVRVNFQLTLSLAPTTAPSPPQLSVASVDNLEFEVTPPPPQLDNVVVDETMMADLRDTGRANFQSFPPLTATPSNPTATVNMDEMEVGLTPPPQQQLDTVVVDEISTPTPPLPTPTTAPPSPSVTAPVIAMDVPVGNTLLERIDMSTVNVADLTYEQLKQVLNNNLQEGGAPNGRGNASPIIFQGGGVLPV